jgi:hypothetical protein
MPRLRDLQGLLLLSAGLRPLPVCHRTEVFQTSVCSAMSSAVIYLDPEVANGTLQ